MKRTVLVSGLYSGPSPSAGLGIARSLRHAFPELHLIGIDYCASSSGLHERVFDETWLEPSWDRVDEALHADRLRSAIQAPGSALIPSLDLEVAWLARNLGDHPRVLAPNVAALAATSKEALGSSPTLPFSLPPSMSLTAHDDEVYSFCRRHSFRVWVKGPYHDAIFAPNWRALEAARTLLGDKWKTDDLFVQGHIRGLEESICFAAHQGVLLDAIHMKKRVTTPEGKTWAGRVAPLDAKMRAIIERTVIDLDWTGGAEIELIRDGDDRLWLNELNPRFPAWIYGAALNGHNLPAALYAASSGLEQPAISTKRGGEFTRVVLEIATREDLPLPVPVEPAHGSVLASGKYGAQLPAIVEMLGETPAEGFGRRQAPPELPENFEVDLEVAFDPLRGTPQRVTLASTLKRGFAFASTLSKIQVGRSKLSVAYSLKTCPDPEYLALAREHGLYAECISQLEVKQALASGFDASRVILNGPGKWWPKIETTEGLRAVFADSVEELERILASRRTDRLWGVRLRLPDFSSRFGIDVTEMKDFTRLCRAVERMPKSRQFGVHFHLSSTMVGAGHWLDAAESAVAWASALEQATGTTVSVLDLGGGYHPNDFPRLPFGEVVGYAGGVLHGLEEVWIEPGRALAQSTMALVTRVLDVRRDGDEIREIVVDASIAELPLAQVYPHRIAYLEHGREVVALSRGRTKILGRICMEDDILSSGLEVPNHIKPGDCLVFADAGAYERTMSYDFGRGGITDSKRLALRTDIPARESRAVL